MLDWLAIVYFVFTGLLFIFAERIAKWDAHSDREDLEPLCIRDWMYGIAVAFFAAVVASMTLFSFRPENEGLAIVVLLIALGVLVALLYFWLGNRHITAKRAAVIIRILAMGLVIREIWELLR